MIMTTHDSMIYDVKLLIMIYFKVYLIMWGYGLQMSIALVTFVWDCSKVLVSLMMYFWAWRLIWLIVVVLWTWICLSSFMSLLAYPYLVHAGLTNPYSFYFYKYIFLGHWRAFKAICKDDFYIFPSVSHHVWG